MSTQLDLFSYQSLPEVIKPVQPIKHISQSEITKEFQDTIKQLSYSRHSWQVWEDFCEMAAISISNAMCYSEKREEQYMHIVGRYDSKEVMLFPRLLALTTEALEGEYQDFLGQQFMSLDMGSKWHGQFFTPYSICRMMAEMTFDISQFEKKGIVTVNEPACGGGAMIIAICEYLKEKRINFQHRLRVICQDISAVAAHMCYIQLSLLGCPAQVLIGNSLKVEYHSKYITPMAIMRGWVN